MYTQSRAGRGGTRRREDQDEKRQIRRGAENSTEPRARVDAAMTAADIVARLAGVRERGPGRWMARCPAHDDRSPSLSIRELDDGTILLHDFAGCNALTICRAIGIEFRDLFPSGRIRRVNDRERPRLSATDALHALADDAFLIAIIGADFVEHREIDRETWNMLAGACRRICDARAACCSAKVPARE